MKKSKYSDAQIMTILRQAESGVPVADLYHCHGTARTSCLALEVLLNLPENNQPAPAGVS